MAVLEFELKDSIAFLTFNRPEMRNAINPEMSVRLAEAYDEIDKRDDVRAAIITGAGDQAFCAGADLAEMIPLISGARQPENDYDRRCLEAHRAGEMRMIDQLRVPVIAAVNGYAIAGGMEMVQATDIRVAVPHAKFGVQEVKWAIFPAGASTVRLPRQVGFARAMELLLTGDLITAEQALEFGFVNHVVEPGALMDKAVEIAQKIAANGPLAVAAIRKSARLCLGRPEDEAIPLEQKLAAPIFQTEDAREGPRAFKEKRTPQFRGR